MRIMFVCPSLGHGGAETQLIALATGLAVRGHAVAVYVMSKSSRPHNLQAAGVEVIQDEKCSRFDWGLIRRMRAFVAQWQPEIVHGFLFDGNLYARFSTLLNGKSICLSAERSSDYRLRRSQAFAHHLTKRFTRAVIANSHAGAAFAGKLFGLPPERVHVVWNGIDLDEVARKASQAAGLRARFGMGPGDKLLCFVGSIKAEKDYDLALEVVSHLLTDETCRWHCLFLGAAYPNMMPYRVVEQDSSVGYASRIEQVFAALPNLERVHRLGAVDNVIELLAQCDVLLSTSVREGFPNVVLEAMACGVPVVSTAYSDIRRILPLPWQVPPGRSAAGLVAAIGRAAFGDAQLVAEAQTQWVNQNASLGRAVASLEAVYGQYLVKSGV